MRKTTVSAPKYGLLELAWRTVDEYPEAVTCAVVAAGVFFGAVLPWLVAK